MKRIAYTFIALSLLLSSCGNDDADPASQGADWTPSFSRSLGQEVRIVGRKDGETQFSHILIPSVDGGAASWKDDAKPASDKVAASNEFIAFMPADDVLPKQVEHDGTTEYLVDYHDEKPRSFTMYPLMAQMKVHIWIELSEADSKEHTLTNDSIYLYTKADVDYPNKSLKNPSARKRVYWGTVAQTDETDDDGRYFRKLSMETPLVVIPQTFAADEEILSFSIGKAHYYFKLDAPVELKPGYLASFTLHVTYEEEEEEGGEAPAPPTQKVIPVDKHTITITPWEMGETYNEQVTTPDK